MIFLDFMQKPAGRTIRIIAGLLLLAYGAMVPTFVGLVAMMAGVASIVTGFARFPHAPPPAPSAPKSPSR